MSGLMLIEGMKKLRLIENKMKDNAKAIQRYSSMVSVEKPLFETEDKQKAELKKLLQSNTDLMARYLELKKRVEYTNLMTTVEIGGIHYAISDLLVIQRRMNNLMLNTFTSLNDIEGTSRLRSYNYSPDSSGKRPNVVRFYKEEDKNKGLSVWQELSDNIIIRLEVINAMTPLMSLPQPG